MKETGKGEILLPELGVKTSRHKYFGWLKISLSFVICLAAPAVRAQGPILEGYVKQGLQSNQALQQQRLTLEQSLESLREARGLFLPSVDVSVQANEPSGQALDIGDLLNPVYSTLNQLTESKAFPTNVSLMLPPKRETTVRATLPVFSPEVIYNYRLRSSLTDAQRSALDVFCRTLVADIKSAYFNYAKTVRLVELYDQTLTLLDENLRVSERLVENDKLTSESVYRARAERSDMQQKRADAARQKNAAQRYFNFLLNRELDARVELDSLSTMPSGLPTDSTSGDSIPADGEGREEFAQLRHGIKAADQSMRLYTGSYIPAVFFAVSYGFQGETFDYAAEKDYAVFTLQARWNLFDGFRTTAKRQGAILEKRKLTAQLAELRQQISLQTRTAYDDMTVARAAIQTSRDRLASAQRSYEMVTRKYELGAAPQIEYIDARTAYTNAASNAIITLYDYYARAANYERVTAAYPLEQSHEQEK